jgi:uncharacterized protein YuzE
LLDINSERCALKEPAYERCYVRATYDREANAAYIYVVDKIEDGGVARTYCCDPQEVDGMINLDFDFAGRLLGIEIIPARSYLSESFLANAHELTEADIPASIKKAR